MPDGRSDDHPPVVTKYAARTNQGFLLRETSLVAELKLQGLTRAEIDTQIQEANAFQLRSAASRQTIAGAVLQRLDDVPERLLEMLAHGTLDLRRLTNMYLILLHHRLLRELITEVALDQLRRFSSIIPKSEIRSFLQQKQEQVPAVGSWSQPTVEKSRQNMVTVCTQAELLREAENGFAIQPQIVPAELRKELERARRHDFLPLLLDRQEI